MNQATEKLQKFDKMKKVGITGSFGKSTTKDFLTQIISSASTVISTPENKNTEMGVSNTILSTINTHFDYFVCEMGAYRIGEISILGNIVRHKDAFLTGINNQHLSLFGKIENTITAKMEIANSVIKNNGTLYVNLDNEHIQGITFPEGLKVVTYGLTNKQANAVSTIKKVHEGKITFEFKYNRQVYTFSTNILGKHNILNLTGVIAYCLDNKIGFKHISKSILSLELPAHTLSFVEGKRGCTYLDDTYNLNFDGVLAGCDILSSFTEKTKILFLDDILELGFKSNSIHADLGGRIARFDIDRIYLVGRNYSQKVIDGLVASGFDKTNIFLLSNTLPEKFPKKDVAILFAGKQTQKFLKMITE